MKNILIKAAVIFAVFFVSTAILLYIDSVCFETTGCGGTLSLIVP